MKTLHAFRRRNETIEVELNGKRATFAPNEAGDVVGDAPDEMAEHLVHHTDGYKVYGEIDFAEDDTPDEAFVLTSDDGAKVDLNLMTEDEVKAFAKAQGLAPGNRKGDKLRQFVVDSLRAQG